MTDIILYTQNLTLFAIYPLSTYLLQYTYMDIGYYAICCINFVFLLHDKHINNVIKR